MPEAAPFLSAFTSYSIFILHLYSSVIMQLVPLCLPFCTHLAGKGGPDVCWTGSLRWQQLPAHHGGTQTGSKKISVCSLTFRSSPLLLFSGSPPPPPSSPFISFRYWSHSRTHKHEQMCGDHRMAFSLSLWCGKYMCYDWQLNSLSTSHKHTSPSRQSLEILPLLDTVGEVRGHVFYPLTPPSLIMLYLALISQHLLSTRPFLLHNA